MTTITMSPATKEDRDRVERIFVRYQELRSVSETWPSEGPSIGIFFFFFFSCFIIL